MSKHASPAILTLFEHADFSVINKPAGVEMHDSEQGIISLMRQQYPAHDWYLVHRLDTGTSGCLLLAKHKQAASDLGKLFEHRQIEKYYLAISDKRPKKKQGLVKGDMQKARRGDLKLTKTQDNPAITQYFSTSIAPSLRLFICKPHTGKTHQIRVALKSQGAPILGDCRYGGTPDACMHLYSYALCFEYHTERFEVTYLPDTQTLFDPNSIDQSWLVPWQIPWPKI
ncbi:TIGR01621 family pseudouridine synthase [Glaciecola sp. SC05]|uniref:TIGR01621 family pseudouridine synthase n=1 Tax=Glaciecola sp. SC05 TaxID=1987355 RepID=UPI00352947E4